MASRKIRYIFTGNLKRVIVSNPHFPGTEKEYLRCQIARINHGTRLEPSINHYKPDDDVECPWKILIKNDEAKPIKTNEFLTLKNWIHFYPGILKQGRVSHDIPELEEGVLPSFFINKDPFDKRMKSVADDKPLLSSIPNIKIPAWKIQYLYDDKIYTNHNIKLDPAAEEIKDNTKDYLVICLRCLRWPGVNVVRFKSENYFFYFGTGQKFADYTMGEKFVYQDFPMIPKDVEDYDDCPEPNSPPPETNVEPVAGD